jgi:stress response protein YsnF
MSAEPVVAKAARVTEEVRLRKDQTERVETVKDTVRREDVAVEQVPSTEPSPRATAVLPATPAAAKI